MPVLSALAESIAQNTTRALASVPSGILSSDFDPQCDTIYATLGRCRTIWDIVWSCVITIFACIWVAIHPNMPQLRAPVQRISSQKPEGSEKWSWLRTKAWPLTRLLRNIWRCYLRDMCASLADKLGIALLALLAPEFIFAWALRQWLRARSLAKECSTAAGRSDRYLVDIGSSAPVADVTSSRAAEPRTTSLNNAAELVGGVEVDNGGQSRQHEYIIPFVQPVMEVFTSPSEFN